MRVDKEKFSVILKGVRESFEGGSPRIKHIHNRFGNYQDVTVSCDGDTYSCGGYWKENTYHLSDIINEADEY